MVFYIVISSSFTTEKIYLSHLSTDPYIDLKEEQILDWRSPSSTYFLIDNSLLTHFIRRGR